jgi:hypothetical protein
MVKVDVASVGALSCFICRVYINVMWSYMEKKDGGKGGRWDSLLWRRATCRSRRGGLSASACCGDGRGVGARAVVGHRAKRSSEREGWGTDG